LTIETKLEEIKQVTEAFAVTWKELKMVSDLIIINFYWMEKEANAVVWSNGIYEHIPKLTWKEMEVVEELIQLILKKREGDEDCE
jgi:hypothetical protein